MPPLPKRKYPKSRQGKRRSHIRLKLNHLIECPQCRAPRQAHTACLNCGFYKDRRVLPVPAPSVNG